jgi:hypothetical protein
MLKIKEFSNKYNYEPQCLRKTRIDQTPSSRQKAIIKIMAEISEIENKKKHKKINEMKSWFFEKIN